MGILKNIIFGWPVVALGTCTVPFLPITGHTYLAPYEKNTRLGPYEIDVNVVLSEAYEDKSKMNVSGYFYYPAEKLKEDGCYLKIDVTIENQTQQEYPNHVVNTEYEKNFPRENTSDDSIDDLNKSIAELNSDDQRLTLTLYDEPKVEQIYRLSLRPLSDEKSEFCNTAVEIKHKVKLRRASMAELAVSV